MAKRSGTMRGEVPIATTKLSKAWERELSAFIEASPDGFILFDECLNLLAMNLAGERLLGLSGAADGTGAGKNILDLMPGIETIAGYDEFLAVLSTGEPFFGDGVFNRSRLGNITLSISAFKVNSGLGMIVGDITERKRAENELKKQRLQLWQQVEQCTAELRSANEQLIRDIEKRQQAENALRIAREKLEMGVEERTSELKKANEALLLEIGERKRVEEALRESEEKFRAIFEQAEDSILLIDVETGTLAEFNNSAHESLCYTREEFQKLRIPDFEVVESAEEVAMHLKNVVRDGYHLFETRHRRKTGEIRDILVSTRAISIQGRDFVLSLWRDITERKRAEAALVEYQLHLEELVEERTAELKIANERLRDEIKQREHTGEALRESEERFRAIAEAVPIPVCISRQSDGVMLYANEHFGVLVGLHSHEVIGRETLDFYYDAADRQFARDTMKRDGYLHNYEFRGRRSDGTVPWVVMSSQPLVFKGEKAYITGFYDVTRRREMEEELHALYQQEKALRQQVEEEMSRRVEFTRALAHELKTPLTPLLISSQTLVSELQEGPLLGLASNISRSASNLNVRIDELLDLARGEVGMLQLKPESLDLLDLLREVLDDLAPLASSRGQTLISELPSSLLPVWADRGRLRQVMMNLLNNALKFTPDGGEITLRAGEKRGNLVVEVRDTGPGIARDKLKLLFKPYQPLERDKERLSGLGLGLSLCKLLIDLHGGKIWVRSHPGKGSTFSFSLPLAPGAHKG